MSKNNYNKMEKEKFYTPKIGELHVGLECQIHEYSNINKEKYFEDCILNSIILRYLLELSIVNESSSDWLEKTIRIKFLNKQDIIDLGFIPNEKNSDIYFKEKEIKYQGFGNVNFKINFNPKREKNISIYFTTDNSIDNKFIFFGTVKNKSELKKILKQLEIYEETT